MQLWDVSLCYPQDPNASLLYSVTAGPPTGHGTLCDISPGAAAAINQLTGKGPSTAPDEHT